MLSIQLHIAFVISLTLHFALLALPLPGLRSLEQSRPLVLQAELKSPVIDEVVTEDYPVIKDTYDEEEKTKILPPPEPEKPPEKPPEKLPEKPAARPVPKQPEKPAKKQDKQPSTALVDKKSSTLKYYPQAAIDQGIEGTVVLMIVVNGQGVISDADIAVSSGHKILDEAALKGVRLFGRLPNVVQREFLFHVDFKLE